MVLPWDWSRRNQGDLDFGAYKGCRACGPRLIDLIKMNRSLLRLYTLAVCLITAFSVLLIAALPLWHSLIHSAEAVQQHEVYQFLETGQPECKECSHPPVLSLSSSAPKNIQPFTPVAELPQETASLALSDWIPSWVYIALRVLIGLIGSLIFAVHWRLYKNLGYVQ